MSSIDKRIEAITVEHFGEVFGKALTAARRTERDAIVFWLRREARDGLERGDDPERCETLTRAADCIENDLHWRSMGAP